MSEVLIVLLVLAVVVGVVALITAVKVLWWVAVALLIVWLIGLVTGRRRV